MIQFTTVAKVIVPYMDSQYVCTYMAKRPLSSNINSSSGVDMNIDYLHEYTVVRRISREGGGTVHMVSLLSFTIVKMATVSIEGDRVRNRAS